jgi:hypothetical protein
MNIGQPEGVTGEAGGLVQQSSSGSSSLLGVLGHSGGSLQIGVRGEKSPRPSGAVSLEVLVEQIEKLTQSILVCV